MKLTIDLILNPTTGISTVLLMMTQKKDCHIGRSGTLGPADPLYKRVLTVTARKIGLQIATLYYLLVCV